MRITRRGDRSTRRALERMERRIEKKTQRAVNKTVLYIRQVARAGVPIDTGYLRESIDITGTGLSKVVSIDAEYANFVIYGTGIYNSQGGGRKDGWVYYNERWGEFVFTRGQRPNDFWTPALKLGEAFWKAEIRKIGS